MTLDPQAKAFLDGLVEQNAPGWNELPPVEGREIFSSLTELFGQGPSVDRVMDRTIGEVRTRVYSPPESGPHPLVLYFHGGGWVLGDLDTHDALCRRLCAEASAVVVSVDYRRSPEHKYPAALSDCFGVTEFVAERADEFGIDPRRIAVAGDSAGGSLALAVSRLARDRGGPSIRFQLLFYPVVERRFDTASYRDFAEGYGLTRAAMIWFWEQYVDGAENAVDEYLAPRQASDLKGLPRTHVVTARYDVLRDECETLAARLEEADVPMTLRCYEGMIHGFVHFSGLFDDGRRALSDAARLLGESLDST